MASPPSSATSPPGPSHLALPTKRPTLALPTGQVKSRKPSFASTTSSTHPLRQTSFPPSDSLDAQHALAFSPGAYSPAEDDASVDFSDDEIMSAISAPGGAEGPGRKRKRGGGEKRGRMGRPRKDGRESTARGGTASLVNGDDAQSTIRRGAPTVVTADGDGGGDEDDEDMGEDEQLAGQDSLDMVDLQQEGRKKAIFRNQLRGDHEERYDYFNRVKLRTQDVRRVVNQTLSQSVPPNVVTTVSAYAKLFAGIIIEEARVVQAEWMAVEEKRPDGEPNEAFKQLTKKRKRSHGVQKATAEANPELKRSASRTVDIKKEHSSMSPEPTQPDDTVMHSPRPNSANGTKEEPHSRPGSSSGNTQDAPSSRPAQQNGERELSTAQQDDSLHEEGDDDSEVDAGGAQGLASFISTLDRGPLLPDHLREALRRYKKRRAGGTVGFTGMSLEGKEVAAPRMGGRRLFR